MTIDKNSGSIGQKEKNVSGNLEKLSLCGRLKKAYAHSKNFSNALKQYNCLIFSQEGKNSKKQIGVKSGVSVLIKGSMLSL